MAKNVVVVIPIYKKRPSSSEIISLKQAFKILDNFTITFVCPFNLDLTAYQTILLGKRYKVVHFKKSYFLNIDGYNDLMLSAGFYRKFLKYKYLLIYQLDAFVFKNELNKWVKSGYDYIGAPWYNDDITRIYSSISSSKTLTGKIVKSILYKENKNIFVGNGGLSLRKTSKFYIICLLLKPIIEKWLVNEDYFWGIFAPSYIPFYNTPSKEMAAKFSLEECAEEQYSKIGELPFGCHGWNKYDVDFWKKHIMNGS